MVSTERAESTSAPGDTAVLSRGSARAAVALAIGLGLVGPHGSAQQAGPPVFPSGVETVRVDVVVTDAKGRPVTGLQRPDFEVREDGVAQALVDFEAVGVTADEPSPQATAPAVTPEPARAAVAPGTAPVALPASFLIVFDEPRLTLEQARNARAFVGDLLAGVREADRVTLIGGHDGRFWSGVGPQGARDVARELERLNGRMPRSRGDELMTPYEAMRIVQGDRIVEASVKARALAGSGLGQGAEVQLRARALYGEATQGARRLLDLVGQALELAPATRGRTTLVLASSGYIDDPQLAEYRALARRFVRTGVTAYFYDARELSIGRNLGADAAGRMAGAGGRLDLGYERQRDADQRLQAEAHDGDAGGATRLADETGGFTIRVSDMTGLARLATDARHYYLLGYTPTNAKRDGKLRRIKVEVRIPGVDVRARKAYYAPTEKDERRASSPAPAASTPRRDEGAVSRYLALIEAHRAPGEQASLDALRQWSRRDLRRAAEAAAADPGCPPACTRAAVLLHTDAAVRHLEAGEASAASDARDLARELVRRLHTGARASDFERFWYHAMGDFELDHARIPDAEELFDALVELDPTDAEARLARGRVGEAGLYLLSLVERTSRADSSLLGSAFSYDARRSSRRGGPRETGEEAYRQAAIADYREALRVQPGLLEARLRLGRVLWLDGKRDEAIRELEVVAAGPSSAGRQLAHMFLSRIEDERGRAAEALAHAEAAVEAQPRWQSGLVALADLQLRAGAPSRASITAARAVAVPDGPATEDGWLLYNLGARDRALATLEALRAMVRP